MSSEMKIVISFLGTEIDHVGEWILLIKKIFVLIFSETQYRLVVIIFDEKSHNRLRRVYLVRKGIFPWSWLLQLPIFPTVIDKSYRTPSFITMFGGKMTYHLTQLERRYKLYCMVYWSANMLWKFDVLLYRLYPYP